MIIPLMAGLTVALLVLGALRSNQPSLATRRRMESLAEPNSNDPLGESFSHRIVAPFLTWVVTVTTGLLPARIVAAVSRQLEFAGNPMALQRFLIIWATAGVVLPLLVMLAVIIARAEIDRTIMFGLLAWVAIGTYLPWTFLRRAAQKRGKAIQQDLPDATDLIITNIEAGLGLQAALLTVSEKMSGPVAEEFGRVVRAISLGRSRSDAFFQMAERSGVADMRLFARAVAQSEQTGIPIAKVLRNHAKESRLRRRQRAREQAAKVPVKMTLPTVLFMFPTLFLLVLGPVILYAVDLIGG